MTEHKSSLRNIGKTNKDSEFSHKQQKKEEDEHFIDGKSKDSGPDTKHNAWSTRKLNIVSKSQALGENNETQMMKFKKYRDRSIKWKKKQRKKNNPQEISQSEKQSREGKKKIGGES